MDSSMLSFLGTVLVGVLSLVGVIVTNMNSNRQIENKLVTAQAVTDTKIQTLTEEVRKHNNFASRIPVIENRIEALEKEIQRLKDV